MEKHNNLLKQFFLESINNYKNYRIIFKNVFSKLKDNPNYLKKIIKYFDIDKDEKYLQLFFPLFFQHQKWINPFNINMYKYSKFFEFKNNHLHDKNERVVIKSINSKSIMKLYVYWHFYILIFIPGKFENKNNNINDMNLIDIENILFQNNHKIINLYDSESIDISDIFIFLYIYLFFIELNTKENFIEKNLKLINSILFSLFFDLLGRIAEKIFSGEEKSEEFKNNINLFYSFLEEIKSNEFVNNDLNKIILLDGNIIQNFMVNLLKNINAKLLENDFPFYSSMLTDFFANFFKFRFNKSKLMDFMLNNIKTGLINLKYFETEKDRIMNDIFLQNFQADLIQKLFSSEDNKVEHPNFNSFLFNGKNSKISFKLSKLSLDDNIILFSFFIKSNFNDKNTFNIRQPLIKFYNEKNESIFEAYLKLVEQNEINIKNNGYNKPKFDLIIKFNNKTEKIIKEFSYLESNITYIISFHLNNSFININLYPIFGANSKILNSRTELKFIFKEEELKLNIGFDICKEKSDFFSGYIGYFHIFKLYNINKNKIDYENNQNIIEKILQLKEYYKYIIYFMKIAELENKSAYSLDYLSCFKNKNNMAKAYYNLEYIKKESKNYYQIILFLSPELFKLSNIKEDNIHNFIIPTIPGICQKQKDFNLNDINITFVRFENSKEEFLMKNGLNYFCFQFEYLYQFANYYKLFLDKSKHGTSNILGELSFDDIKETCFNLIKKTINNNLLILSKFIIDFKITFFSSELKQIFSTLLETIKSLNDINCIINSIFHQLSNIFIIVCEQIVLTYNMNVGKSKNIYDENKDVKFLVSFRDSIIDILLTKDLYNNAPPEFVKSLFDKIILTIESNNAKDISLSHPNILLKVLTFVELLKNYFEKYIPNWKTQLNEKKGSRIILNSYIKLLKGLLNPKRGKIDDSSFFKKLVSNAIKENKDDISQNYLYIIIVNDLIKEGFSLDDKEISDFIYYIRDLSNIEKRDDSQENDKNNICILVLSIIINCIFEKNKKKNFTIFCNEIKQLDLNENLFLYIINEILRIFSNNMDAKSMSIINYINNNEDNNSKTAKTTNKDNSGNFETFDFKNFFEDLFEFILCLIKKYFYKRDIPLNQNQNNNDETILQNKPNRVLQELMNLIFFIEEMVSAHINNMNMQITTFFCLLNLIKLIHIIVFDDKFIELFSEDKFILLFKSLLESCVKSRIIYTNYFLNPNEKPLYILKNIPECILDILVKLNKSDVIKNNKDENKIKDYSLTKKDIISALNEIFLIDINQNGQKDDENKRSIFCYNDVYRYFLSKRITNLDNEIKSINKNKNLIKYFPKFLDNFRYLYQINNLISGKENCFNYNFITFNVEKIYMYKYNLTSQEFKDLSRFLETLLTLVVKEHDILYKLDKDFFFKANSEYTNYNKIKNKIEKLISLKKLTFLEISHYLDLEFGKTILEAESINSGKCENNKDLKRKIKGKEEQNRSFKENFYFKNLYKKSALSSIELGNSPGQLLNSTPKNVQNDDSHSINSRTSSYFSTSDVASVHSEEPKSPNESSSNLSPNSINNNDISMESFKTTKEGKILKDFSSISDSNSSLLSANPTNTNTENAINVNNNDSSSNHTITKKTSLLDDINCNFLNELDSMYLFNVKRDLMKNIFSLNFLDTIFNDKTFIILKKEFFKTYGQSLEGLTENIHYLNYPTKIKNFSNGLEPSLFLKPYNDFYTYKTFPITHQYFSNFIEKNKLRNKSINLIEKQIFIPQKDQVSIYQCEIIKINRALYGNLIYSKSAAYLYFEQTDFKDVYKKYDKSNNFEGIFSLSANKIKEKSQKNVKHNKSKKLFHKNKKILILLSEIEEIVEKRFLLMWQGLEIYLKDGRSYFLNLLDINKYKKFAKALLENEELKPLFHKKDYLSKNKYITRAWEKGNITTYEYLLFLNKYGSRSLSETSQYYVFPWIISHFDDLITINNEQNKLLKEKLKNNKEDNNENNEENVDIKNLLSSLRDLKYPLSQQNEEKREDSMLKFDDKDKSSFQFHLGTHYSTGPFIFYYLMRQEPYSTLLIKLQNYQQENPNRMFIGVKETIEILETGNDNRELIPEFFSKIEFFLNLNYSYFGQRASHEVVNNARIDFIKDNENSPLLISDYVHFIFEHRNLLNSNLISYNINDWINNIFGIGQLPSEKNRKACCNIFNKSSYEKYNNLYAKLKKYIERMKTDNKYTSSLIRKKILNKENFIISFGQTPSLIFKEAHPKKEIEIKNEKEFSANKDNEINNLSYKTKVSNDDEDEFFSLSKEVLRPKKYHSSIKAHCIYFDNNNECNKIYALSNKEVHEFNFSVNNDNDADIMVLSYQKQIKIPYIKLFENFNVSGGIYYIYKPKYAFSSFRVYDYIDHSSRKDSKISNSKIINSEKNFNFNNYYKNLFQNMYMKKNIDNQNDETNKFIHCRYLDNSFKITIINKVTKLKIQKKKDISISTFSYICEDFVSSCCTISSNQFLTGLDNGKLIRWNIIKEDKDKIEISFDKNIQAHRGRINVIEIDQRMGLIITSGKDNLVQIRKLYNLELLTPITIKKKYVITMAKVSPINFLYIMCFDMNQRKSIIYGYTLTGIRFAKIKGGLFCNIDFTRSGNIVTLLDNKELCILNAYDLSKKENIKEYFKYKDDLIELKNIEGANWLEYKYFLRKPNSDSNIRINNLIIYIKKGKQKDESSIIYYDFKENKIFE